MTTKLELPDIDSPGSVLEDISGMPEWDDIPGPYRKNWHRREGSCGLVAKLFFEGGEIPKTTDPELQDKFTRVFRAWIGSWAPTHERKIAALGWLIDSYCDTP